LENNDLNLRVKTFHSVAMRTKLQNALIIYCSISILLTCCKIINANVIVIPVYVSSFCS